MTIHFTGSIDEDKTVIQLEENQGQLTLLKPAAAAREQPARTSIYLYLKERQPQLAALAPLNSKTINENKVDQTLIVTPLGKLKEKRCWRLCLQPGLKMG